MFQRPDLVVKEVVPPHNHWCKTGHSAPKLFQREGASGPETPTKFFQVASNQMPSVNGVYCEPCLIIANALKKQGVLINPK